jgi:methyl-accepting chemotaxis protein
MRFLERFTLLRMWHKLAVIAVALGVPAIALAAFYISSLSYDGGFLKAELSGLEHIDPLNKMNEQIEAHRTMVDASLRGDETVRAYFKPKIAESVAQIEEQIKAVDAADAKNGAQFGTSDQWKLIKAAWAPLAERSLDLKPDDSAAKHAKLLADLLAVELTVSEKSNLILDPILVTYYLQDNLTLRTAPLIEFVSQTRALAHEIAAKKEITPKDRYRLAQLLGQIAAARAGFDSNVAVLKDRDPTAYAKLAPKHAEATAAADTFVTLIQSKFIEAPGDDMGVLAVPPSEVWEKGSEFLAAYRKVNDEALPVLRSMLTARYDTAAFRLYGTGAFVIIVMLLAGALVYGIARGITEQVDEVNGVLAQIGVGNVSARAAVMSRDELGNMAFTLNAMLDNTMSLLQSQEEKDQIQQSIQKLLEELPT